MKQVSREMAKLKLYKRESVTDPLPVRYKSVTRPLHAPVIGHVNSCMVFLLIQTAVDASLLQSRDQGYTCSIACSVAVLMHMLLPSCAAHEQMHAL